MQAWEKTALSFLNREDFRKNLRRHFLGEGTWLPDVLFGRVGMVE